MNFVSNIIANSMSGFVEAGTRAAGGYAGDALIKAGDMIEGAGRGAGSSVERKASDYGTKLAGQAVVNTTASLPKTQVKKALPASAKKTQHPNATPKSYKPPKKTAGNTSTTPIGANKYPGGGNKVASAYSAGRNAPTKTKTASTAAQKTKGLGLPAANVPALPGANLPGKSLPKPFPNDTPYPTAKKTAVTRSTQKKELAKPYPNNTSWPAGKKDDKPNGPPKDKPYPGTNTLPGQASRTPVKKYKAAEPYKPPVQPGQEFKHI